MLYQSDRSFRIWAYSVSHGSLILRSEMKFPDDEEPLDTDYNIDFEIWGVTYINIPEKMNGITITVISPEMLPDGFDPRLFRYREKIFEIQSENRKYMIIAAGLLIGTNQWASDEDRIFKYHLNLQHDQVLLTA